ncbi:hypothetical protein [Streptomyces beihaiensis]|uniref:Extensin n=1 Tax=Streptomyces beihaiensis TaxID=2984495 RepID=A0ABT3TTJ5_9ACTN|nr:hypothetical protein [Streptomyces beihaiensis]MCX3059338.1 hypothetical protein [Streptomyces beihaiensis]
MADEHYKWLNREAAERLLRGEPLKAVENDDNAAQARQLAAALDALAAQRFAAPDTSDASVTKPSAAGTERAGAELPGEEAALKAFRDARAVSAVDGAVRGAGGGRGARGVRASGAGARPGGPRWTRPIRYGLAAAVAACMVGGVAVAAGVGFLPSPFGGGDGPTPATSVSPAATQEQPLASPSPDRADGGVPERPDGSASSDTGASGDPDHRRGTGANDDGASKSPGGTAAPETGKGSDALHRQLVDGCRDYRDGRLGTDAKQRLRDAARTAGNATDDLGRFCDKVISQVGTEPSGGSDGGGSTRSGDTGGGKDGKSAKDGKSSDEDGEHGRRKHAPVPVAPAPASGERPGKNPGTGGPGRSLVKKPGKPATHTAARPPKAPKAHQPVKPAVAVKPATPTERSKPSKLSTASKASKASLSAT